ncbi:MAG: hypothetical protein JJT89_03680 [Nitriliruptoraceae bacterium]|nr:hypothetical protein [Nitriliruptoraceae bacterium]
MGSERQIRFRERSRPPVAVVVLGLVGVAAVASVVPGGTGRWWEPLAVAAVAGAFVFGLTMLVVIEVDDAGVSWHRRSRGLVLPHDRIDARIVLTGTALRKVSERNIPSLRVHRPPWERRGVLLVARTERGVQEHVLAVRDLDGFREALGVARWDLVTDDPAQLPGVERG